MIFGAKKDISRKEHVGLFTVVQYKGSTQIYYRGSYQHGTSEPFDKVVAQLKRNLSYI